MEIAKKMEKIWVINGIERKIIVDPDAFLRFAYARLLDHRQPRYAAMARLGLTVTAEEVAAVKSAADFDDLIARALEARGQRA